MLRNYLIIAWKILMRRKFLTVVSLFGVAFTLLVLVVGAAVLDHLLATDKPESLGRRFLVVDLFKAEGPDIFRIGQPGYALLDRYVRTLPDVEAVSVFSEGQQAVSYHQGRKIVSHLKRTDGEFWQILDFEVLEGRPLNADDEADANFVAVISRTTRARFFGGGPALGQTLEVDQQRFRVVGVVEDVSRLRFLAHADIWVPISTAKTDAYRSQLMEGFQGLILARSRADFRAIQDELEARMATAEPPDPAIYESIDARAVSLAELAASHFIGARRPFGDGPSALLKMCVLLALGGLLFMALPAINLVNLNISRIAERASEIGVRKAYGASSRTLVGQFVVENVVLTLIGAAVALVCSIGVLRLLNASGLVAHARFTLDLRVFLWGVVLAVLFGLLSGVYPAWRMSRLHPAEALSGRSS